MPGEAPEEEPDLPPAPSPPGQSIIDDLSRRLWEDRGLRKARVQRTGSTAVYQRVERAIRAMGEGDDHGALDWLRGAVRQARAHNHEQMLMTPRVLGQLADRHIARRDFANAALVYREMLQLGHVVETDDGTLTLRRLPAVDDPLLAQVRQIRSREHLFLDTLDEYFADFNTAMFLPYRHWRRATYRTKLTSSSPIAAWPRKPAPVRWPVRRR